MTFRAMVDSQHKSPLKKRRMQNSSDAIQQEVKFQDSDLVSLELLFIVGILFDMFVWFDSTQFMDLRTRYTALVTLITQYVKFASETLKRAEDEEVRVGRISTPAGADAAQLTSCHCVVVSSGCLMKYSSNHAHEGS